MEDFQDFLMYLAGDPVPPYVFLLAIEGLSSLLKSSLLHEIIQDIKVAPEAPHMNHLLFADDSLLFFDATLSIVTRVSSLLKSIVMPPVNV